MYSEKVRLPGLKKDEGDTGVAYGVAIFFVRSCLLLAAILSAIGVGRSITRDFFIVAERSRSVFLFLRFFSIWLVSVFA